MPIVLDGTVGITTPTEQAATTIGVGNATPSTSGAGITFPATQSPSTNANTLDDYEEGTFTVGWTSTGNTFTPHTTTGYYTKIGRLVTVTYLAYMAGAPTIPNPSNAVTFTGLPFTSASTNISTFTWGYPRWNEFPAGTNGISMLLGASTTQFQCEFRTGIGELVIAKALTWSRNGSGISFTGSYFTA
jgi:hypothetical protein